MPRECADTEDITAPLLKAVPEDYLATRIEDHHHDNHAVHSNCSSVSNRRSGIGAGRPAHLSLNTVCSDALSSRSNTPRASSYSPRYVHRSVTMAGPLHLKPEVVRPLVMIAKTELNPREVSVKFLQKFGARDVDWSGACKCSAVPSSDGRGMSEASMYHAVLEVSIPMMPRGSPHLGGVPRGSGGGSLTSPLTRVKEIIAGKLTSPRGGAALALSRQSSSHSAHNGDAASGFLFRVGSDDGMLNGGGVVSGDGLESLNGEGAAPTPPLRLMPPSVFILKHYDTSVVETPSMALRLLRHLTNTTSEKMLSHEVFFYTKVAPFLHGNASAFRIPKLYFAAQLDRGNPGLLKYVCCRSGSGTVATLGLEDMSRSGFTFTHEADDGLYDEECITSALVGLADLHSSFWGRVDEPHFAGCEPSTIPRCVHRCGNAIVEKMSQFRAINLHTTVFRRWRKYPPMRLLKCEEVQRTLVHVQRRWKDIREKSVQIISKNDTILHGDCHYRNLGFRRLIDRDRRPRRVASVGGLADDHFLGVAGSGPMGRQLASTDTIDTQVEPSWYIAPTALGGSANSRERDHGAAAEANNGSASANSLHVQTCFLDFQSSGPGSAVAEILYFICTSVPVEVSWTEVDLPSHLGSVRSEEQHRSNGSFGFGSGGGLFGGGNTSSSHHTNSGGGGGGESSSVSNVSFSRARKLGVSPRSSLFDSTTTLNPTSAAAAPPPATSSSSRSNPASERSGSVGPAFPSSSPSMPKTSSGDVDASAAAIGAPPSSLVSGFSPAAPAAAGGDTSASRLLLQPPSASAAANVTHHTSATAMSFHELYEYDVGLLHQYHAALDPAVRAQLPLEQLVDEVFALARHWAGTIVVDMVNSSVEERLSQKKNVQLARLLDWSEATAQRVIWMATAAYVYEHGDASGSNPLGQVGYSATYSDDASTAGYRTPTPSIGPGGISPRQPLSLTDSK